MKKSFSIIFIFTLLATTFSFFPTKQVAATTSVESQLSQLKGGINQVIIATTDQTSSTNATISYYHKKNNKWVRVYSKMSGLVGKNGITSNKKEGDGKTPKGVFSLTTSFGTASKPTDVKLPYKKTNSNYYWVDDVKSSDYNKMVYYTGNANNRWNSYERLTNSLYSHAVVINYNINPIVKGNGSAIFLHTRTSKTKYTLGCVAIYKDSLVKIMKQLDPTQKPHIIISEKANLSKTISDYAKTTSDTSNDQEYQYFAPNANISVFMHMTGSATIGTLYKDEAFPIIKDEFVNWYKVKVGNSFGYVKKSNTTGVSTIDLNKINKSRNLSKTFTASKVLYVKENITGKQVTIGKISKNQSYPIVDELEFWYQIDFSGRNGYVWKANTSLDKSYFSPKKNMVVYKHMTGNTTIGTLYKNEVYPIIKDEFINWYEVKLGNTLGYIKKKDTTYLSNTSVPILSNENKSIASIKAINDLYVKENISGKQITFGKLDKGIVYPIISESGNWYKINFMGRVGYVWKYNASIID